MRTSAGTGCGPEAVFEHTETPTRFYKARVDQEAGRWRMTLTDGTVYYFNFDAGALVGVRDRFGNGLKLSGHFAGVDPTLIETTTGRWLKLTYDGTRITQAQDNLGRTASYTYNADGYLATVTDPAGGVTEYTYDPYGRMLTIKDPRTIVWLTNEYGAAGRVIKQTQAAGTVFQFAYTLDGTGKITQVDVTDPRGFG